MTTDYSTDLYESPKSSAYWQLAKEWSETAPTYSPQELWQKAISYFEWAERNPLQEQKIFSNGIRTEMEKLRLLSENGFCLFADICMEQFATYLHDDIYEHTVLRIQNTIYTQNMEGAAADLLHQKVVSQQVKTPRKIRPRVDAPQPVYYYQFPDNEAEVIVAYELEMKEKAEKKAAEEKASREAQERGEVEEEVQVPAAQELPMGMALKLVRVAEPVAPAVLEEVPAPRHTGYRPKRDAKGRLLAREGRRY